jgi:hypothetical protein
VEGFTKEEVNLVLEKAPGVSLLSKDGSSITMKPLIGILFGEREYINRYAGSLAVARWASLHVKELDKIVKVHGPGGVEVDFHNHLLLQHITDDMLVAGAKTSFSRVQDALNEVAKGRLTEQLNSELLLPVLPGTIALNPSEYGINQIVTGEELKDEGNTMEHCVAGYVESCKRRISYIFHVGEKAPNGATVEVCKGTRGWFVAQCKGVRNSDRPVEKETMDVYLSKLNERR